MKLRRFSALLAMAMILLAASPGQGEKPLQPVGQVTIEITGVGAIVGLSWGDGLLRYGGKNYPLRVEGLSLGDVGVAKVSATGKVYNLKRLQDFSGTYLAAGAGVSLAGGIAGLTMQNQKGVIIDLYATQQGVKLNLGPQGITIRLR